MRQNAVDPSVVAALAGWVALLFTVAWRARRATGLDYLLAGRRLTTPAFVATLVATWYGGVLGVGEFSFRYGISNWLVFGVPYYLAALVFALVLAERARKSEALSIPDQLRTAYGPGAARVGAVLVLAMAVPAAYVLMLGELTAIYLGWPLPMALPAVVALLIAYAIVGGFRTVVRTNAVQMVLMYTAFALLLSAALAATGGLGGLWVSLPAASRAWDGGLGVQAIAVWYLIAMQTLVEPTFYQRCYAAQTPRVARRGILISIGFWIVFDFMTTFSGLAARVLLPGLENPVLAYPELGRLVLSPVANAFFAVGLFATVMSTAHSYLFLAAATIGHDVAPELARRVDEKHWSIAGMVLAGAAAVALALTLRSVVAIWHDVGSIVTAALLLPLALSHAPPRWRFDSPWAVVAMVGAACTALLWVLLRTPTGAYPLGLEPIFPALAVSGLAWLPRRSRRSPLASS